MDYCLLLGMGSSMRNHFCEAHESNLSSTSPLHAEHLGSDAPSWRNGWRSPGQMKLIFCVESSCDCCINKRRNFFCESAEKNSRNTLTLMVRAEKIRMLASKEANFFRRGYRILWVTTYWGDGISIFKWTRSVILLKLRLRDPNQLTPGCVRPCECICIYYIAHNQVITRSYHTNLSSMDPFYGGSEVTNATATPNETR